MQAFIPGAGANTDADVSAEHSRLHSLCPYAIWTAGLRLAFTALRRDSLCRAAGSETKSDCLAVLPSRHHCLFKSDLPSTHCDRHPSSTSLHQAVAENTKVTRLASPVAIAVILAAAILPFLWWRKYKSSKTYQEPAPKGRDTMPPLTEEDEHGEERSASPSSIASTMVPDLAKMSQEDRYEYYDTTFAHVVPIEQIAEPNICRLYPDYTEEITNAYLQLTTFSFRVWINYDAAAEKFFTDARIRDCGEVRLPAEAVKHLRKVRADKIELRNVQFDIGTAFRTLARLIVEVRPSKLNVGPQIDTFLAVPGTASDRSQSYLKTFLDQLCDNFRDQDITDRKDGLTLANVEQLAARFLPMPSEYGEARRMRVGYDGMFVGAYGNDGYMEGIGSGG